MTHPDDTTDPKPYRDEDRLRELYQERGLTTREIADELGCTNGTVSKYLNEYDIETRENWKAGVEAAKEANRVERVALRTLPSGYEYWASKEGEDRTNLIVYVHRLLAIAEHGFDAVADVDVHHCNGVPWDNRPENIELMDKAEHAQHHSKEYWSSQASAEAGPEIELPGSPPTDLSGTARIVLPAIVRLDPATGVAIHEAVNDFFNTDLSKPRIYHALSDAAEAGYVARRPGDGTTTEYVLTDEGREVLEDYNRFVQAGVHPVGKA